MAQASGGYLIHKLPLVRSRIVGARLDDAESIRSVSETDLRALNAVQATPWRINERILDVASAAFDAGLMIAGLPGADCGSPPARFTDEIWESMSADARKAHVRERRAAHEQRASLVGKRHATADHLTIAAELRSAPAIWFPHNRDFRGRIYPIPMVGPHPQANDLGKALIHFERGLDLGDGGLFWLLVRAANTAGHDKLGLEARAQWALDNRGDIVASADDPLGHQYWAGVDDPWQFLATCFELAEAWGLDDPRDYISYLPVQMDGTCNGLQHLSAMGGDPVGAKATNLASGTVREDIYESVAEVVRAKVARDAEGGRVEAVALLGTITRATVKRAVMTTPYGVTDRGIRNQLLTDGMVPGDIADRGQRADYLRDCIVEALDSSISSARAIMGWLQGVAGEFAKASLPFDWTTPSGSHIRQAYPVLTEKRVVTLAGKVKLDDYSSKLINPQKQRLGAAPNYVHSFDASHMMLTVAACDDLGIKDWSLIHDSYGTHAGNTDALGRHLRAQFVEMYSRDRLVDAWRKWTEENPGLTIEAPPERGEFNIEEVLAAEYFFS